REKSVWPIARAEVAIGATGVAVIVARAAVNVVADPTRAATVGSLAVSAASAAKVGTANRKRLNHEARRMRGMAFSPGTTRPRICVTAARCNSQRGATGAE